MNLKFHPAVYLKEFLLEEFAKKVKIPKDTLENFMKEKIPVSEELATKLETGTGIPAKLWMNLQKVYDNEERIS